MAPLSGDGGGREQGRKGERGERDKALRHGLGEEGSVGWNGKVEGKEGRCRGKEREGERGRNGDTKGEKRGRK